MIKTLKSWLGNLVSTNEGFSLHKTGRRMVARPKRAVRDIALDINGERILTLPVSYFSTLEEGRARAYFPRGL
ncbi:hypothetical protein WDW86_17890 [Bdellovibrionota bacterium FG-2]